MRRPHRLGRALLAALLLASACAPALIEERETVALTVVEAVQEAFDGRSAATGFIVGKVPGAVLMGVARGGPCRVTLNTGDAQTVTIAAPPDACKRLKAGDQVTVRQITRRPAGKPPPETGLDVRYEWDAEE